MNRLMASAPLALVLVLAACAQPDMTGPSAVSPNAAAPQTEADAVGTEADSSDAPDITAFTQAQERLGRMNRRFILPGTSDVSSRTSQSGWALRVLRAPETGQVFKVNRNGMLPQPAPKFRFDATAPMDIPNGAILVLFLTSASKECGLATTDAPLSFRADQPTRIDIPNRMIIVGPDACFLDGQNCTRNQCKFPLTTTKVRIVFGGAEAAAQGTASVKYKWTR